MPEQEMPLEQILELWKQNLQGLNFARQAQNASWQAYFTWHGQRFSLMATQIVSGVNRPRVNN